MQQAAPNAQFFAARSIRLLSLAAAIICNGVSARWSQRSEQSSSIGLLSSEQEELKCTCPLCPGMYCPPSEMYPDQSHLPPWCCIVTLRDDLYPHPERDECMARCKNLLNLRFKAPEDNGASVPPPPPPEIGEMPLGFDQCMYGCTGDTTLLGCLKPTEWTKANPAAAMSGDERPR